MVPNKPDLIEDESNQNELEPSEMFSKGSESNESVLCKLVSNEPEFDPGKSEPSKSDSVTSVSHKSSSSKSDGTTTLTSISANDRAVFNSKRQNASFGRWRISVMVLKMQEDDASDRRKALQSLCDYVYDSKRVASKEFGSIVPHLKNLTKDENDEVRLKVAECFAAITITAAGRQAFNKFNLYKEVLELLKDEQEDVRHAASVALQRASVSPICLEAMVKVGAIENIIKRLPEESNKTLVYLLQALHSCCLVNPVEAVNLNGLEILVSLLEKPCPKVKEKTLIVITDLTVEAFGRNKVPELSSKLITLCLEEDDALKAKSLAAMMMLVNSTSEKLKALENGAIEIVLPMLNSENIEIRMNAVKVLTALAETPQGRKTLLQDFHLILQLMNDDILEIRKAAEKLISVVKLEP